MSDDDARIGEAQRNPDFELMPDLTCGRTYRSPDAEARTAAMREGEQTPFTGCGKPLRWLYAYRCRQCGRWLHGPCMDQHFWSARAALAGGDAQDAGRCPHGHTGYGRSEVRETQ